MKRKKTIFLSTLIFLAAFFLTLSAKAQNAPDLLLAQTLQADTDVSAYLVSEKYDGVRAFWDGKKLQTRSGALIHAPKWFTENFPNQPLDGELWAGRGRFEATSGAVRKQIPQDNEWRDIRYMVFELPGAPGTFRERATAIEEIIAKAGVPWLNAVQQSTVRDRKALQKRFNHVVKEGGEGLMLHRADAPYVAGRSDTLLKMKAWHDAEATVIGYLPGKGKYKGLVGALRVRTESGLIFKLGTGLSVATRTEPPPIGTVITYRYRELTRHGVPRFASYYRMRNPK